jgi:hypothetical protein
MSFENNQHLGNFKNFLNVFSEKINESKKNSTTLTQPFPPTALSI